MRRNEPLVSLFATHKSFWHTHMHEDASAYTQTHTHTRTVINHRLFTFSCCKLDLQTQLLHRWGGDLPCRMLTGGGWEGGGGSIQSVHTTTHQKKNTYTHSVYSRKRVWKNHRLTAVKMKLRHGEIEGAPSSLFPAAFHYLKHQPSHTHHTHDTHTQVHLPPSPRAVCLHFMHTSPKNEEEK